MHDTHAVHVWGTRIGYDRKLEKKMKRLSPSALSDLLADDEQEPDEPGRNKG